MFIEELSLPNLFRMEHVAASRLPAQDESQTSDRLVLSQEPSGGRQPAIIPDAEFSRELLADPAGAARALYTLAHRNETSRNLYVKECLASKFSSVMQVVLKQPAAHRPKILQYPFVDAVMEVILDEESYCTLYYQCSRSDAESVNLVDRSSAVSPTRLVDHRIGS